MAGVEWSNLHVAGAFVVGAVVGGAAVVAVTRLVMIWLRDDVSRDVERRRRGH